MIHRIKFLHSLNGRHFILLVEHRLSKRLEISTVEGWLVQVLNEKKNTRSGRLNGFSSFSLRTVAPTMLWRIVPVT